MRSCASSTAASPSPRSAIRRARTSAPASRGMKQHGFGHFARATANAAGRPTTFAVAVGIILAWAVLGPLFGYSDTWQLVINTATTIVTFLMVFLIQNTQNRDAEALHIKIDELIRSI